MIFRSKINEQKCEEGMGNTGHRFQDSLVVQEHLAGQSGQDSRLALGVQGVRGARLRLHFRELQGLQVVQQLQAVLVVLSAQDVLFRLFHPVRVDPSDLVTHLIQNLRAGLVGLKNNK